MRKAWLVCYDIADSKRWRRVYRTLRAYGDHVQLSVFRCALGRRERVLLQAALERHISMKEDHVLFIDMGPVEGRGGKAMSSIGKPLPKFDEGVKIF